MPARSPTLVCALVIAACRPPDPAATLRGLHERVLEAHRRRDAEALSALEADTVTVSSGWVVTRPGREERLAQRRRYFGTTRFSVYRDLSPPVVQVSPGDSVGWVMASVEVVSHPDTGASTDSSHVIWRWIELYKREGSRWVMVGNVSSEWPARSP